MRPDVPDPRRCPDPPDPPDVRNLVGLAFSGGGIRSASFNLGVLQGLASRNVLWIFDYLSTVSGGGFIGSWWSAWLSRAKRPARDIFPSDEELEPGRRADTAVLLREKGESAVSPGPPDGSRIARRDDPIHFLRLFSNYLTPKSGAFSPDTWRLAAFFARNLLFTWIVLLPILLSAVMAGQAAFLSTDPVAAAFLCRPAAPATSGAQTVPVAGGQETAAAGYCAGKDGVSTAEHSRGVRLRHLAKPMAILLAAYATLAILWLAYASTPVWLAVLSLVAAAALVGTIAGNFGSGDTDGFFTWAVPAAVAATLVGHMVQAFFYRVRAGNGTVARKVVRATAADFRGLLGKQQAWLLRLIVFVGLLLTAAGFGHDVVDALFRHATTWIAGVGWGGVLMAGVSGIYTFVKALPTTQGTTKPAPGKVGAVLVAIAPPLALVVLALAFAWVSHSLLRFSAEQAPADRLLLLASAAAVMAVVQVVFAVFESFEDPALPPPVGSFWYRLVPDSLLPASARPPAAPSRWLYLFSPRGWVRVSVLSAVVVLALAAKAGLTGLMLQAVNPLSASTLAVATLAAAGLVTFARRDWRLALGSARPAALLSITAFTAMLSLLAGERTAADAGVFLVAPLWIVLLVGFVICTGWLADPNLLSLHGFYKGRLARAYLGASNTARRNEEITDAAPGDDISLTGLWNHDSGAPYHLINTTLSLVGGSDLAMSQRSAENFVMSRYHCGSARAGYRCTADYMRGQLSLATAAAISGAAVSPNMGSKTPSAALALFLSLFNVRLGFWAPTPSGRRWKEPHARLWPFYVLRETLSNTGQIGTYCYLTDGGHFDNTGLYALVERGCRYIVVCDCGADPNLKFEDIGVAIRRCRIDFGTEIDLRIDNFAEPTRAADISRRPFVWGSIRYQPEHLRILGLDPAADRGVIVWIKPTVTALNAVDVQQYHRANPEFPQQSTADQSYDESQFESYRRLGYESARDVFSDAIAPGPLPLPPGAPPVPPGPPPLAPGDFAAIPRWFDSHL
jgi:hypothetical protein